MNPRTWRRRLTLVGAVAVVHFVVSGGWTTVSVLDEGPDYARSADMDAYWSYMYSWWQLPVIGPVLNGLLWWPIDPLERARFAGRLSDLAGDSPLVWLAEHLAVSLAWSIALYALWSLAQAIRRGRRAT